MQNTGGPAPGEMRNIIIAIALSAAILFGFEALYGAPQRAKMAEQQRAQAEEQTQTTEAPPAPAPSQAPLTREQALNAGARVTIDSSAIDGSISLQGARIDDLNLRGYYRQLEPESGEVTLLSPMVADFGHDAFFGWEVQTGSDVATLADVATTWSAPEGARLTPATPLILTLSAGPNLSIERTIAIDEHYMFTITDVVNNRSDAALSVRPFGVVRQHGASQDYRENPTVFQGLIGAFGPNNSLQQSSFKAAQKHARQRTDGRVGEDERIEEQQGQGGWFGITDHYWLAAIVPDQGERVSAYFDSRSENNTNDYRAAYRGQWRDAPAGGSVTYTQRFFAGAKRVALLREYQSELSVPRFDNAVDWDQNLWFLTRPFFLWLLQPLANLFAAWGIGINFALAIVASTVVIKAMLFPLVYQSYKSMARMRAILPKQKEIQEKYAADKQRQQQEILKLYQTEKVNPISGCIPQLLTIPVFFALYKTLSVTIEMRHAPFVGWIQDLSAKEPLSMFNLFGLLPLVGFDFHSIPFLGPLIPSIGVLALLYGVSMWALQSMSPPATDPVQAQVFAFMPVIFTVMFAGFPSGLVIYWLWSNVITIGQQYLIMRHQGVETEWDKFLAKRFPKKPRD